MALLRPTPPPAVTQAYRAGLTTLLDGPSHLGAGPIVQRRRISGQPVIPNQADVGLIAGAPPGTASDHDPQQVFVLGLADLANGKGTAAARFDGWRIFAGNAPDKTVLGRLIQHPPGIWKLTACFYWTRVWDAFQASLTLDSLPAIQTANYELRVLSIPGLNLDVFWLVAQPPGTTDLVVPFPLAPNQPIPGLNIQGTIPVAAFLTVVVPLAKQRVFSPPTEVS